MQEKFLRLNSRRVVQSYQEKLMLSKYTVVPIYLLYSKPVDRRSLDVGLSSFPFQQKAVR
jgi:hypothetical protein